LVYGETLDGHLTEDKGRSVLGVDPETVLRFKVEKHCDENWAVCEKESRLALRQLGLRQGRCPRSPPSRLPFVLLDLAKLAESDILMVLGTCFCQ
jgi:hypothetical protein